MYPVILVHGIARFDILVELTRERLNLPDGTFDDLQYFRNIQSHLEANGILAVYHSNEDFAGSVELRASQLADKIQSVLNNTGQEKVHLIGHSMGGLDARHAIVDHQMASKVASLSTIGTPHLGTVLADRIVGIGGIFWRKILEGVINLDGVADLTISACSEFNGRAEASEAANDVVYHAYSSCEGIERVFLPLIPSWELLMNVEGDNDGLVPVWSQNWQSQLHPQAGTPKRIFQHKFPFGADHLNQVGWWDSSETILASGVGIEQQRVDYENGVKDLYLQIVQAL